MANSAMPNTHIANPHLESLTARHARLEARLADEQRRPVPDPVRLTQIKREKLRVKEEVARSATY